MVCLRLVLPLGIDFGVDIMATASRLASGQTVSDGFDATVPCFKHAAIGCHASVSNRSRPCA